MKILLVDDQPEVVSGVLVGVNWKALNIDQKFVAYDILKAKNIIESHEVDLMLCDIEMPLGSGLELYKWVLEKEYKIKCIFLTAHADFSYMQSAIKMHGFDYLLQPVTYEQVEESIRRAIDKIKMERLMNNYYEYGITLKKQENTTTESLVRDYLLKYDNGSKKLFQYLRAVSIPIREDTLCRSLLLQVLQWTDDKEWNTGLFQYAINNVLHELLDGLAIQMMTIAISRELFFLIYIPGDDEDVAAIRKNVEEFIGLCQIYLQCRIACYESYPDVFSNLPEALSALTKLSRHNVARVSKLFSWEEMQNEKYGYTPPAFTGWTAMADQGLYKALQSIMLKYLDDQTQKGNMSIDFLRQFHQDFMYWFFITLSKYGVKPHEVFSQRETSEYNYEALMNSYTSLERMKNLIGFVISYLQKFNGDSSGPHDHMDEILEYIHKNIQKNITRKDLADTVYLNAEYLSRLFKKEKGCTLLEFINREKMEIAKSMLESTNFSISIVASKVGYSNFSHFTQCFKKYFGITPSEVRRNRTEK